MQTQKRLQMLLRDLRRLEADLLTDGWYEQNADNRENSVLFADVKSALDNVRTSLWCRIHASTDGDRDAMTKLLENHRLTRAVELLRSVNSASFREERAVVLESSQEIMNSGRTL